MTSKGIDDNSFNIDDIIEYTCENEDDLIATEKNNLSKIANVISVFYCKKCDFSDTSLEIFVKHHQAHENTDSEYSDVEEIFVCSECYAQHRTIELLKKHMISDHKFVPIPCTEKNVRKLEKDIKNDGHPAEQTDVESSELDESNDLMTPVPFKELKRRLMRSFIYKCSIKRCFYKFETREKQESHIRCHISTELDKIRDFKCIECGDTTETWRLCAAHMWKQHKIDVDLLKCPVCTYKAITSVKIWRHLKVHGKWRSKVLKKRQQVKKKIDVVGNRWYSQKTCEICSRNFANSKTLSKHVKTVHNKIKPFICSVCGWKSARKTTWIVHMRQHTGDKPLLCKTCPYRASDPSVLKKHEMRHNKSSQYKCKVCDYTSIQSSPFKIHVKTHHPEEFKKLSCDQCSYVCVTSESLECHKKDHMKGLIPNKDFSEINNTIPKNNIKNQRSEKAIGNVEISSDCFLPLESTDSFAHDPSIDTGGVTIPAHSEDTQFPIFTTP